MKNLHMEKHTYRVTSLSPFHIQGGDGSGDYGMGYFRRSDSDDYIYLVDTVKLQRYIYEHHGGLKGVEKFANLLTQAVENKQNIGIKTFLDQIGFDYNNTLKISKGKVYARTKRGKRDQFFIRNGMDQPYLPGSSIKGVLRTAVLWKILKSVQDANPEEFKKVIGNYIEDNIQDIKGTFKKYSARKKKENFTKNIVENVFQSYSLIDDPHQPKRKVKSLSPFTDLFRCIKVKDSVPIAETDQLTKDSIRILSFNRDNLPYFKTQLQVETCFLLHNRTPVLFDLILDQHLLQRFINSSQISPLMNYSGIPFTNLDDLMNIVAEFSNAIWSFLVDFYQPYKTSALATFVDNQRVGEVTKFISDRGFGFIRCQENPKLFFHINSVNYKFKNSIDIGDKVRFDIGVGRKKKPEAKNVIVDNSIQIAAIGLNINNLINFYEDQRNNAPLKMKLGWGTGLLGTSLALLLQEDEFLHNLLVELRDDIISVDKKKHGNHVPKSARVTCNQNGEPEYPLGWIRLEKIR